MNKLLSGGLLSALALAGTAAVAVPSFAGDEPGGSSQGEVEMSPLEAAVGEQVRVSDAPGSGCFEGTTDLWWAMVDLAAPVSHATGQGPVAPDGSWDLTFSVPDVPGDYTVYVLCLPPGKGPPDLSVLDDRNVMGADPFADLLAAWEVDTLRYYAFMGPVPPPVTPTPSEPASPTTVPDSQPTPTPAPPATPIAGQPTVTG